MISIINFCRSIRDGFMAAYRDPFFWCLMALTIIIVFAIIAPAKAWPTHDRWGYRLPEYCRQDLSFLIPEVVIHYDNENGWTKDGLKNIGLFHPPILGRRKAQIFLDKTLTSNSLLMDVLHHELCHYATWKMTGDGSWHEGDNNVPGR